MDGQKIIHTALEHLKETTGIEGRWAVNGESDGLVTLTINKKELPFHIEVKREIRPHQIEQIKAFNHHFEEKLLVIAERIYPKAKQELKELRIPFLEANGNIHLKKDNIWIWIDTNPPTQLSKGEGNRAFTKTGLKVVFHFLLDDQLINKTHRLIAGICKVAIGNIPQIIDGLKRTGYIYPLNEETYMWEDRKALLDRWITEYATTLRPALLMGRFQVPDEWEKISLNPDKTLWGGEPAASIITQHLRPEEFIIYTKENIHDLVRQYGLKPDPAGNLYAFEWFWDERMVDRGNLRKMPAKLIYTDLMIKGDKRCRETANKILSEYLENFI